MKKLLALSCLFLVQNLISAQEKKIKTDVSVLPVVFYLPETSLGMGSTVIIAFKDPDSTDNSLKRNSNLQPSFAYTLKNQLLFYVPYELYLSEGKYRLNGELGYYRYFYNFYGVGPESKLAERETYDVNFPRIRIKALRRLNNNLFAGMNYRWDLYDIVNIEGGGKVDKLQIPGETGGVTSTIGPLIQYDSRDNNFYPRKGWFATLFSSSGFGAIGSTYDYTLIELNASTYKSWKGKRTLAFNLVSGGIIGAAPFYEYFYISSPKRARGFNDRRYMDRNLFLFQAEYKMHVIWRFDAVVFGSLASLESSWLKTWEFDHLKSAGGLGLRFKLLKDQEIRLRADVGYAEDQLNFYITVGEAF